MSSLDATRKHLLTARSGRGALSRAMDLLSEGVAVCDASGNVLHRNDAFDRVMLRSVDGTEPLPEVQEIARRVADSGSRETVERELFTGAGRAVVRLQAMECDVSGANLVAIAVETASERAPSLNDLRRRFSLTAREAEIALLLAAGKSNAHIARLLLISAHTARHHTERVLAKLSVRSRAEVGARIRAVGWPDAREWAAHPPPTRLLRRRSPRAVLDRRTPVSVSLRGEARHL